MSFVGKREGTSFGVLLMQCAVVDPRRQEPVYPTRLMHVFESWPRLGEEVVPLPWTDGFTSSPGLRLSHPPAAPCSLELTAGLAASEEWQAPSCLKPSPSQRCHCLLGRVPVCTVEVAHDG
jgi:hypothetical protein